MPRLLHIITIVSLLSFSCALHRENRLAANQAAHHGYTMDWSAYRQRLEESREIPVGAGFVQRGRIGAGRGGSDATRSAGRRPGCRMPYDAVVRRRRGIDHCTGPGHWGRTETGTCARRIGTADLRAIRIPGWGKPHGDQRQDKHTHRSSRVGCVKRNRTRLPRRPRPVGGIHLWHRRIDPCRDRCRRNAYCAWFGRQRHHGRRQRPGPGARIPFS